MSLFSQSLSYFCFDVICSLCVRYGKVGDIYVPRDRRTGESRGFAFVRYFSRRSADEAMSRADGKVNYVIKMSLTVYRHG